MPNLTARFVCLIESSPLRWSMRSICSGFSSYSPAVAASIREASRRLRQGVLSSANGVLFNYCCAHIFIG